ncbi:hypothetical protein N7470_008652 [Penicillium chermesinum]|nr:hypothetical protein N7470_008652 [Penicillium chermesinum]
MEVDNPNTPSTPAEDRRKSGRATRRPEVFSQTNYSAATGEKRKRGDVLDGGDESDSSESESDDDEEDADEEELREKRRAARKAGPKKAGSNKRSHASKKPKVAGNGVRKQLAFRPALNGRLPTSRPRKPKVRPSLAQGERGLYADVFGKSNNADSAAAQWLNLYQKDSSQALRDFVNFMLRCAGSDLEISSEEVEDVDHAPEKMGDLQTMYHEQGITEYPLISRAKKYRSFQPMLEEFAVSLVQTFHHSSVLYTDEALFENIQIWLSFVALSIMNALCDIAREVTTTVSTSRKQLESEKKKKSVNKGRVEAIQTAISEGEKKVEQLDEHLQDGIDTVFVHRYRDVDGTIRAECMAALGRWIRSYREIFFEGQYLRYIGWTLADTVANTRLAALSQLLPLYENKDNVGVLSSFTERFRQRIVEIATQDADIAVRVTAIELLIHLREGGLLEPGDVDAVGQLILDVDPRIRTTAGRFFAANVEDAFESLTEEVSDDLTEIFADDDEDDFESPKRSWIKFKCLAASLMLMTIREMSSRSLQQPPGACSREHLRIHAGYLLYDHSSITDEPSEDDTTGVIRNLYKMQEGQESILLEVLCASVKLRVLDVAKSDIDKRGRKVKALTAKIPELQEEISHGLAQIIPQLLNNDINKQFLTHSDQDVLAEASVAFLHAKSSEEMREALEGKVQELWDDLVAALGAFSRKKEVQNGASISEPTLTDLTNTVTRIANLAGITDCTTVLEKAPSSRSKNKKEQQEAPFNTLIHLVKRGLLPEEDDEDVARVETELVGNSIRTLLFYFMWKVQALSSSLASGKASFNSSYFEALTKSRETFTSVLLEVMDARSGLDDLRFVATSTYLDLQTLFSTLRNAGQGVGNDEDIIFQTQGLVHEVPQDAQALVSKIHNIAERIFAKKSGRKLEPAEDDAPASEDEDDEEDEDEGDEAVINERLRSSMVAEQRLCELTGKLVLAIIGRVIDASGSKRGSLKKRLLRNKSVLGQNYREVLSYMEERKPRTAPRNKGKPPAKPAEDQAPTSGGKDFKSAERIADDDGESERGEPVEEDEDEDLRARELVEEEGVDQDVENDELNNGTPEPDEDDVMGD